MFAVDAEFAEVFAVVGGDDDGGVVVNAGGLEGGDDGGDLVVGVPDAEIVAIDHTAHGGAVGDRAGVAGEGGVVVAGIHVDVERRVRAGEAVVAGDEVVVVEPGGDGGVGEGGFQRGGGAVGSVRVPVVDVEIPVVAGGVVGEPAIDDGLDGLGGFHAALAGVVDFVEAGVEMPGGVALPERTDHGGVEAELLKLAGEALVVEVVAEVAAGALDFGLGGGAAVSDHAGVDAEPARVEGGARRQAGGVGRVGSLEYHALAGKGVDGGAGVAMIAVAAEVVGAKAVDVDVKDAHGISGRGWRRFRGGRRRGARVWGPWDRT